MTHQPLLNGDELAGLGRADAGPKGKGPHAFTLGGASAAPSTALPALDRLNERLARRFRDVMEPLLRAKPMVEAQPAALRRLGDWLTEQPAFAGYSVYSFRPFKGQLAVATPAALVSRVVDAFYGGGGAAPATDKTEFSASEHRVMGRLSDALVAELTESWRDLAGAEAQLKGRETNVALAGIGKSDDMVAVCRFTIAPAQGGSSAIDILLPAAALRALEGALALGDQDASCTRGSAWRAQLSASLADVRIEARTVLARPELSLAELVQLKVGDVIPVSIPALVPLLVEGRTVALGTIGEQDGKAALQIERVESRRAA
jgi:flagellar motor switch protein FliM